MERSIDWLFQKNYLSLKKVNNLLRINNLW